MPKGVTLEPVRGARRIDPTADRRAPRPRNRPRGAVATRRERTPPDGRAVDARVDNNWLTSG